MRPLDSAGIAIELDLEIESFIVTRTPVFPLYVANCIVWYRRTVSGEWGGMTAVGLSKGPKVFTRSAFTHHSDQCAVWVRGFQARASSGQCEIFKRVA